MYQSNLYYKQIIQLNFDKTFTNLSLRTQNKRPWKVYWMTVQLAETNTMQF